MEANPTAMAGGKARSAMMTMKRYGLNFPRAHWPTRACVLFYYNHPTVTLLLGYAAGSRPFITVSMLHRLKDYLLTPQTSQSDNNDFCSSCRGSGFLLCCDGCDRSFHFACLDPPLSQDASELQEPWFCFRCVALRVQPQKQQRGLFSALLANLDKRNPSIFNLPQDIRDHFEGVATGKDGRFLEAVNSKTR